VYCSHFDVWLTNHLQLLLEATRHLIPESQTLTGWVNGDLYVPAGEKIGILPITDSIRVTADIESYQHSLDSKNKNSYLARQQGSKYAIIAVHTTAEKVLFKKLMQENPLFSRTNVSPDWKQGAKVWNQSANGQDIFYKVDASDLTSLNRPNYVLSWGNIFMHTIASGIVM
jgi:hypothetical protein